MILRVKEAHYDVCKHIVTSDFDIEAGVQGKKAIILEKAWQVYKQTGIVYIKFVCIRWYRGPSFFKGINCSGDLLSRQLFAALGLFSSK